MKEKIKVLIVDDHGVVRSGLKLLLQLNNKLKVCGEAENIKEAIIMADRTKPDIILLDFKLPDGDGVNGCLKIKKRFPETKVIILTAYSHDHIVMETIKAGADGYLLKNIEGEELLDAIFRVHKGDCILDPSVTEVVFNNVKLDNKNNRAVSALTPKEEEILELISLGKVNKEIASTLNISDKTVRNYVSNILKKLNLSNRTEAASYWIRNKILK